MRTVLELAHLKSVAMSQEFKIGERESIKNNFGRRQVEVSLLRTVLERAHMQKSVAMAQEFNPKDLDSEDLYR